MRDINGRPNASTAPGAIAANPADTTAPTIASIARVDPAHVDLAFSEVMDKASVETPGDYTLDAGAVTAAALRPDGRTVRLAIDDSSAASLTVSTNVRDINGLSPAAPLIATVPPVP